MLGFQNAAVLQKQGIGPPLRGREIFGKRVAESHVRAAFVLARASLRVDGAANIVRSDNAVESPVLVQNNHLGSIAKSHMRCRVLQGFRGARSGREVAHVFAKVYASD